MKTFILMILFSLCCLACTDEISTKSTLTSAGYTDIQTYGYSFWSCGEDDAFHTKFTAINPIGKRVSGTVCCGFLVKDCTIRF